MKNPALAGFFWVFKGNARLGCRFLAVGFGPLRLPLDLHCQLANGDFLDFAALGEESGNLFIELRTFANQL